MPAPTTHVAVRQGLAAALDGHAVTAGTLREAPVVYDRMASADGVPDGRVHLAFALAILSTALPAVQRQSQGRDLLVTSTIGLRVLHRLRRSDEVADLDSALATMAAQESGSDTFTATGTVIDAAELFRPVGIIDEDEHVLAEDDDIILACIDKFLEIQYAQP